MKQLYLPPDFDMAKHSHTVCYVILLFLLCLFAPHSGMATQKIASGKFIELSVTNVPLKDVLAELERQTDYNFVVNHSRLTSLNRTVTVTMKEERIEPILDRILDGTNVTYKIRKKQITFFLAKHTVSLVLYQPMEGSTAISANAADFFSPLTLVSQVAVSGKTTEAGSDDPLPGVNIVEKGTANGVTSDADGNFRINVSSPTAVLVFSFIGYATQEVAVGNQTVVNVRMVADSKILNEVVVVGYGTQEKSDVTGSISSVKGSDIANLPVAAAQQALQGRAAGVNVVRSGGAPGDAGTIRIRGTGTVNDANPLIVIDGVPAGGLSDVNPNDIESIDVLKDASASAIYGTRAANGVVIVTTKRGKFGDRLRLNVSGYSGVSNRIKSIDVLDAPTLAMLKRERYTNDGIAVAPIWEDPQYQTQRTDWQNELLGQGTINNIDLSVSSGSERSSFALSGAYYDEKGMISNSFFKRYSLRINSDHKISNRVKVGQNLQVTNQSGSVPNTLSAQDGLVWSAIRFHPGQPVKNADGKYSSSQVSAEFGDINNPIFTVDTQDKLDTRTRILGSINGDLELLKGLHARVNFAVDAGFSDYREFNIRVLDQIRTTTNNSLTVTNDKAYSLLQEYFLAYNGQRGEHSIGLTGGYSQQTFDDMFSRTRAMDLPSEDPSQRYLTPDKNKTTAGFVGVVKTYDALQSFFGRATYDFSDKYLATLTYRRDGSSKFGPDNRWANFPAFSVGWRLSKEPFFSGLTNTVSNLKLTAGWGELGNQNIPSLQYLALITTGGYRYSFGNASTVGSAQSSIANANIGWERAEVTNIGLEAGLLQDQVLLTLGYFNKQTKDMLLAPPSLGSSGTATIPYQNVGQLENKGVEIEVSYRKTAGDLTYTISGNATFITNKVIRLYNGNFLASQLYGRSSSEISRTIEGHPIATFYGWKTDGLYQNQPEIDNDPALAEDPRRQNGQIRPGDVRFLDLNNDHMIDDKDRTIIGSPQPKVTYGLNAGLNYKTFDFNLFFLGVGGVDIYNADRMQGIDPTYPFNMYAEAINRWHGENTSNTIPRMTTARDNLNHRTSDMFVESGAFFRLKNVTLGYSLPQALTRALHLSRARFYATGQNVFIITQYSGMDPELGYVDGNKQVNVDYAQYPQSRTWTIGAQLSF